MGVRAILFDVLSIVLRFVFKEVCAKVLGGGMYC